MLRMSCYVNLFRECVEELQYKDVNNIIILTVFKICEWKYLILDFQLKGVSQRDLNRDVISIVTSIYGVAFQHDI